MSEPRPLRIEYPGAIYHVMSRGDRREPVFKDDQDRQRFLATMDEAAAKTEWQIHAVCLMPNHVPIVLELGEHGVPADTKAGRREFEKRMEVRRAADLDGEWRGIRRGWCLGHEEFREELLAAVRDRLSEQHPGDLRVESAEQKAGRIVTEELSRLGWTEAELGQRAKGDAAKVSVALRVRQETTVTLALMATRLVMGSSGNVRNRLWHFRRSKP